MTRTRLLDKLSDTVASFVGSWTYIFFFMFISLGWMYCNLTGIVHFDPFPFILLNLMLSYAGALPFPLILMSQGRIEARDRERSKKDYENGIKAEHEIRDVLAKLEEIDKLLTSFGVPKLEDSNR